jgi:hypothetical protein
MDYYFDCLVKHYVFGGRPEWSIFVKKPRGQGTAWVTKRPTAALEWVTYILAASLSYSLIIPSCKFVAVSYGRGFTYVLVSTRVPKLVHFSEIRCSRDDY